MNILSVKTIITIYMYQTYLQIWQTITDVVHKKSVQSFSKVRCTISVGQGWILSL